MNLENHYLFDNDIRLVQRLANPVQPFLGSMANRFRAHAADSRCNFMHAFMSYDLAQII
jgi:hypothetical protein